MGKTRDIFKETGDTKGIFHAKIGTEDDKNGKDLTGAEEIKERWQEYPDKLYRKRSRQLSPCTTTVEPVL